MELAMVLGSESDNELFGASVTEQPSTGQSGFLQMDIYAFWNVENTAKWLS